MGLAEIHQSRAQSTAYSWRSADAASICEARHTADTIANTTTIATTKSAAAKARGSEEVPP